MNIFLVFIFLFLPVFGDNITTAPLSVPGIATLRPTAPTMPDAMLPDADRGSPTNKTEELPIAAVYFIMLGITGIVTWASINFETYGSIIPLKHEKEERQEEEW